MRAVLEKIKLKETKKSFHYFKRQDERFKPFWHYHPEIELTLISKGVGTRFVGDSILPFKAYDLVLIGENLPHHWVSIDGAENQQQEAHVFQFGIDLFNSFPELEPFKNLFLAANRGIHFSNPSRDLIAQIISFETLPLMAQFSTLINILVGLLHDENQTFLASEAYLNTFHKFKNQPKISNTTNYIIEHLNQKITVDEIASLTHMAPQSFCRWFKKYSGHSFVAFLNKTRIERACYLLINTDLMVQEIAFTCGFESLSHFNRTFKSMKNTSPLNFKKSIV